MNEDWLDEATRSLTESIDREILKTVFAIGYIQKFLRGKKTRTMFELAKRVNDQYVSEHNQNPWPDVEDIVCKAIHSLAQDDFVEGIVDTSQGENVLLTKNELISLMAGAINGFDVFETSLRIRKIDKKTRTGIRTGIL